MKQNTQCKTFVKARTANGLKVLMVRNNLLTSAYHDYNIIYDGTEWFAWFEYDATDDLKTEEDKVLNERSTKG